ncbi:Rho guanyl nucleotide exchange factor [Teratosphaeria destructans]|uniref:Rho guanyl nucleotide exchange factor n=1 Tax=Teratosphaeria destructans TaxID=418781 RepID=A0A9W7SQ19_9PEZI|nr:Rho guanyl nucleotide exchange factor [Teratosphaeria destructans]
MSHSYQGSGQYHHQHHQQQQQPYHDPYAHPPNNHHHHHHHHQQPQHRPNGTYPGQPQYAQPTYPGQPQYDQYQGHAGGGPVQQAVAPEYDGYQTPGSAPVAAAGYASPRSQYPPQQTYNPAQYGAPQPQQPIQQYNPQAYASTTTTSPYPQQYNPAAYPETSSTLSGPLAANAYGYSPGAAQYAQQPYSPQASSYGQSPSAHQSQFTPQHSYPQPPPPPHAYGSYPSRSYTEYSHPSGSASVQPATAPYSDQSHGRPRAVSSNAIYPPSSSQHSISPALPGLAEDQWMPSPPQHQTFDNPRSPSPLYPSQSPLSSPPGPTPPAHASFGQRSESLRHPQSRPLPGPPEPDVERDYFQGTESPRGSSPDEAEAPLSQEELFSQVENAMMNAGHGYSPSISVSQAPHDATTREQSIGRNGSGVNGHRSPAPPVDPHYSDDSDAEANQGLAMLRMADEEDARRASQGSQGLFSGYGSQRFHSQSAGDASDSDDYGAVDMTSFGGGFAAPMTGYGNDPSQLTIGPRTSIGGAQDGYSGTTAISSQQSSLRRSHASQSSQLSRTSGYDYTMDSIHPFPSFDSAAQVDMSGTGGCFEPSALQRRQSYDEGDEYTLMEGQLPERFPDEPPDIFFHQSSTNYTSTSRARPLPAVPGAAPPPLDTGAVHAFPAGPDAITYNAQGQVVPRSTSLISHQTTPQVPQPLRSKTDAEERRLRAGNRSSTQTPAIYDSTPASSVGLPMDLPSLGAKRFIPAKLGAPDFAKCDEPWSLKDILRWLFLVVGTGQEGDLKEAQVNEALVALFTNKVPTMNIADAEGLSAHVIQNMFAAGTLVRTEEWVKLVPGPMSGVIFQLTGAGCYAPTLHDHIVPGRCYSHHCQRTLKKVNLRAPGGVKVEAVSWSSFYGLEKEYIETKDRKEVERQNVLHEIISTEESYLLQDMHVLSHLYRDQLQNAEPSIISPKRKDKFMRDAFGKVEAVLKANEEHLLPQLKYRQKEQGPWIVGFSDIFRQWIRKAKQAYIDYAIGFPGANFLIRQEMERNIDFRTFAQGVRQHPLSRRLSWDNYVKAPITRLQRYSLLLQSVYNSTMTESEEKNNLMLALNEVRQVTMECDARVADMQRKVDLSDLSMKLVLRPGMQGLVELNLDHFGRELVHRGDLQRMGGNKFTWLDAHAILFDHYLVLAKTVSRGDEKGGRLEKYDVSRLPIPMDLLILESTNDPAVQKSTYVKGITSVTTVSGRPTEATVLGRTPSNTAISPGPSPQHVNTGCSANSLQTVTSHGEAGKDSDKIMWPFRLKHLGKETYTLFAPSETARRDWISKIVEAKTKHAASLHNQHAEPFRLRVMADSAFVFDAYALQSRAPVIKGTPVDRAIQEVETRYKDRGRPGPVCRARVNCATSFTTAFSAGSGVRRMLAVGTDFGVYVSDVENPRGWTRAIQMSRVTQISVLEDFNLFLLIADKALIAYHLDAVVPTGTGPNPAQNDSARKAPQKLSGSKDVGFFVAGRMKDRQLVFYKKRENLASVFKVLEPIYQKSTEKKRGIFKRGSTEFFREYDEFYIPAECSGMNLFHSSLAVSTARGFEVLTLDKKQPWTVPDLKASHVQNIAAHIKDQRALGMLRLSEQEFLLCYQSCAVYVNKHGEISRSVILDFVGNAQSAALYGAYLILFDNDFVEIRNAQNGRLKQVIAGREIKCLDDGAAELGSSPTGASGGQAQAGAGVNGNGSAGVGGEARTVKFVMQHPESEKTQLVVELVLNENMRE